MTGLAGRAHHDEPGDVAGLAGHAQDDERFARRDLNKTFDSIAEEDALMTLSSAACADSFPDTFVDTAAPPAASSEIPQLREQQQKHIQAPSQDVMGQDWFGLRSRYVSWALQSKDASKCSCPGSGCY